MSEIKCCRLTKLRVEEVSSVDKAANGRKFLILKRAEPQAPDPPEPGGICAWFREAIRKAAGRSGPTNGGNEMTPEEIKKAVSEAAEEALAPIIDRIEKVEESLSHASSPEPDPDNEPEDEGEPASEPAGEPEAIAKLVGEAVASQVAPLAERLEALEKAAGSRQSALPAGAHAVQKAGGPFSWQGSGLLL
jgi:hypothetical protein